MPDGLRDGKHRLHARQRLANDPRKETRRGLVGSPRPHTDRGQPKADAVQELPPMIVCEEQLARCLLRAVRGQRR